MKIISRKVYSKKLKKSLVVKKYRATDLAYLAGIIDGEGCIKIAKAKSRHTGRPQHWLQLEVSQKDGRLMSWIHNNFGGKVIEVSKNTSIQHYRWTLLENQAIAIIKEVLPFLTVKKEQAKIAIMFQSRKAIRGTVPHESGGAFHRLPDKEIKIRSQLADRISYLKKQYKKLDLPL